MFKIRDKEHVLNEYQRRYAELDNVFVKELGKEYDRYVDLLKSVSTREEAMEVFAKEIARNERSYKSNTQMNTQTNALEGSPHNQYMEILANYGLIVFFRDNMISYKQYKQ